MKKFVPAILALAILSCESRSAPEGIWFSADPVGNSPKATRIDAQQGDELAENVTVANFKEVTIAQGSGMMGFNAIRIFTDGSGYAVFSKKELHNQKVLLSLSKKELKGLIAALNNDKITRIKGVYSAAILDGTQGFVEIKTTAGHRYCWLSNHFDPVVNTYAFCEKVIWPKIKDAEIEQKKIDRQAEKNRVFGGK